jgi:hypothetical protein
MANELLDFVMSLVRDPDAAARYAENPQQAIADAHLTDVTSADVNNLIPVVSESLSMASPAHGIDAVADGNVWSSGAATAAFDAFSDHVPVPVVVDAPLFDEPAVAPVGTNADQWTEPDLHTFDAVPFDASSAPVDLPVDLEVHDVPVDPGFVDPGFDHPVDDHPGGIDMPLL